MNRALTSALARQQGSHGVAVRGEVDCPEHVRTGLAEADELVARHAGGGVDRLGGRPRQHLLQVPAQLVQTAHHRQRRVHRRLPGTARERHLHDVLPRTEAVVGDAAREPAHGQLVVDPAARIGAQMHAGCPGGLVHGEVGGRREPGPDAAQGEAAPAVGLQRGERVAGRQCAGGARPGDGSGGAARGSHG